MNWSENVSVVLNQPQSAGNIGAVARVMKNMGLSRLILVDPQTALTSEAYQRACGADEILDGCGRFESLLEALASFHVVVGTSSRNIPWIPGAYRPSELAEHLVALGDQKTALVFGSERTGLTNEQLNHCRLLVTIPTDPQFGSMNLSQAVAIVVYELYQRVQSWPLGRRMELAESAELERLFSHLEQCLSEIGFLDKDNPQRIMATLRQILSRAGLEERDVQILRGILRQWSWYADSLKSGKVSESAQAQQS